VVWYLAEHVRLPGEVDALGPVLLLRLGLALGPVLLLPLGLALGVALGLGDGPPPNTTSLQK
jgi:hypothetical protein